MRLCKRSNLCNRDKNSYPSRKRLRYVKNCDTFEYSPILRDENIKSQ